MLIYYLHLFRDSYWPDALTPGAAVQPPLLGEARTDQQKLRTRYMAKEKMMQNIPGELIMKWFICMYM